MELLDPVASALNEMSTGTTKKSIFYNYLQHCRNVSSGQVDPKEEELLPVLNKAIINTWGAASLDSMKKRAWDKIDAGVKVQNQSTSTPQPRCKFCPSKRGKLITLGCQCTSHRECSIKQIVENMKSCREVCLICNTQIQRPATLIKALQDYLKNKSPFDLNKNSLQPVVYYYHDYQKKAGDIEHRNLHWKEFCQFQAEKLPSWARPSLLAASKKKVKYQFTGTKWD